MIGIFFAQQLSKFHRNFSTKIDLYKSCYEKLGVAVDSDQNTVREAFISLVQRYHPESGHHQANCKQFAEIDQAFRILLEKFAKERRGMVDDSEDEKYRLSDSAAQTQTNAKVVSDELSHGTFFRSLNRLAEQVIQEAISRGDFDRLSGIGKPLSTEQSRNPYVDFTQHKLNEILIENGFTPEWIRLQHQIRDDTERLKNIIRIRREDFGEYPLTHTEFVEWIAFLRDLQFVADKINERIDKYNLIVPTLNQQLVPIRLRRIAERIVQSKPEKYFQEELKERKEI